MVNIMELNLIKPDPIKHTPEFFGLKSGDFFVYINKQSVFCLGTVILKFNVQTRKNELYFQHVNMQYLVPDLSPTLLYKYNKK